MNTYVVLIDNREIEVKADYYLYERSPIDFDYITGISFFKRGEPKEVIYTRRKYWLFGKKITKTKIVTDDILVFTSTKRPTVVLVK